MSTTADIEKAQAPAARVLLPSRALGHVLVLSGGTAALVAAIVLFGFGGWDYYTTPVTVRGYAEGHRLLRPSGAVGHLLGIGGFVLMLVPIAYSIRKHARPLRNAGSMRTWLEIHIFCGIVGPVLVTFHTSFKFRGLISAAYWSMVTVVLSGFVGRYLFVRIPRSLRGIELTQADLDARALEVSQELADAGLPADTLSRVAAFEQRVGRGAHAPTLTGLFLGEIRMRRDLAGLRREITGVDAGLLRRAIELIAERATLKRQAVYLQKTKALFEAWHIFHMPLVYVMFVIVVAHVIFTMYMGYLPFVN